MKRLVPIFLAVLLLTACGTVTEPEFVPTSGVQMDLSKLEEFTPVEEIYTRRFAEKTEELIPGDYGMLRPFVGSRAAFDMTIYSNSGFFNGRMGLIDDTGAIVVDPVYTDVHLMADWYNQGAPKFYSLSKEIPKDGYMDQIYGFCTLNGSVAEPCIYESISYQNGYMVAVEKAKEGLFRIFDEKGTLLLDSADWEQKLPIYSDMGYSLVDVAEHLILLGVTDPDMEYGMEHWLCDWDGNVLTKEYDYVTLTGDAPYPCGNWGGGDGGYLDAYGNLQAFGFESVLEYHFGQAIVKRNGQEQVIDLDGNVLWTFEGEYVSPCLSDTGVYYQQMVDDGMETVSYTYRSMDFEPMYPEADHVSWLYDDWFLVWEDGVGRIDNGKQSAVLEGAQLGKEDYYYGNDVGAEDLLLITTWKDSVQAYWLFDEKLELLTKGSTEDPYVQIMADRSDGSSVAVTYKRMTYPYSYEVLDYPGAPELKNVKVLDIHGGWYLVEDEFSAGYMDAEGNWLFRYSLMTDMVD